MKTNLACVLLLVAAVVMAQGCGGTSGIAGTYKGDILTGDIVWPGATTFKVAGDGEITGTYELDENGTTVTGELSHFSETGLNQYACRWKDKAGVGDFTLTFSDDLKSFEGFWSNDADANKTKHGWGGKK